MLKSFGAAALAAIALAPAAPAQNKADDRAQVEDIVVLGRTDVIPAKAGISAHLAEPYPT